MRKFIYLLGVMLIISIGFTGCSKKEDQNDDDPAKGMNDLIISDNFDWRTTKTVDVSITLPTDDFSQIVNIYSISGEELYYTGYATNNDI